MRYPAAHDLLVLARSAGGPAGGRHLDAASAPGRIRVRSGDLAARSAVLVASERRDEDPGWHPLNTGELLHVGPDLQPRITTLLDAPPVHPRTLVELGEQVARSQQPPSPLPAP